MKLIHINFNLNSFSKIMTKDKLIAFVEIRFVPNKNNYLLIDEV